MVGRSGQAAFPKWYRLDAKNPPMPRSGHCMAVLPPDHSHDLLVFGGYTEDVEQVLETPFGRGPKREPTNEAYLFSLENSTWSRIQFADGDPQPERRLVAQTVVVGRKLWLFCGWNPASDNGPNTTILNDIWVLDLHSYKWNPVVSFGEKVPIISRFQAAAVNLRIWIHNHRSQDDILAFDTESRALSKLHVKGRSPASRGLHSMTAIGTKLYVYGGASQEGPVYSDLFVLDTESLVWSQPLILGEAPTGRCSHGAAAIGNLIFFIGGAQRPFDEPESKKLVMLNEVLVLDTKRAAWMRLDIQGEPPRPRNAHTVCAIGTKLVVYGGWNAFVETYGDTMVLETAGMELTRDTDSGGDADKNNFEVMVVYPRKEGNCFSRYTSYKLVRTGVGTSSGIGNIGVRRRYSQFELLRQQLVKMLPQIPVPALPPKQVLGRFDKTFVDIRKEGLHKFVTSCLQHPIIRRTPMLCEFLGFRQGIPKPPRTLEIRGRLSQVAQGPILLVGVSGNTGRQVVQGMLQNGVRTLRAMTRDATSRKAKALATLGVQICSADLDDKVSLAGACAGIRAIYIHTTCTSAESRKADQREITRAENLVKAAKAAAVSYIVYHSAGGVDRQSGLPFIENKYRVEHIILTAGLPATMLRATMFMDELWHPSIRPAVIKHQQFSFPMLPERRVQMISCRDMGLAAAHCFKVPESFVDKEVELASDDPNPREMAEAFSQAQGCTVTYSRMTRFMCYMTSKHLAELTQWYREKGGYMADVSQCRHDFPGMWTFEEFLVNTEWASKDN